MIVRPGFLVSRTRPRDPWIKLVSSPTAMPIGDFSLSGLGVGDNAAGTYLFQGEINALAIGSPQIIFHIDVGATVNRFLLQAASASALYQLSRNTAGVPSTNNGQALTAGVPFTIIMSIDGSGGAVASFDGNAATQVAGGPTTGLVNLRVGQGPSGSGPFGGTAFQVWVQPGLVLSVAEVEVLAATFA